MPSSDLILNVRQVAGYSTVASAGSADAILMQRGGLGGPYVSISPEDLVGTALSSGGAMVIGGSLSVPALNGGGLAFSNGVINKFSSSQATITSLAVSAATINGDAVVGQAYVNQIFASLSTNVVNAFNGRRGDVWLNVNDIIAAGGAALYSPNFQGVPTAPTPPISSNDMTIATTAFVQQAIGGYLSYWIATQPLVFTFNGRSGDVTLQASDLAVAGMAPLDSPAFTGIPTAPTAVSGTNNTQIATTGFVTNALATFDLSHYAPINSPAFTGAPSGPTAPPGTSTGELATTAFVMNAVAASTAGVSSWNTRTGAVTMTTADITNAGGALLASPIFTGNPVAPTPAPGNNSTSLATTAFVTTALLNAGGVTSFNSRTGAVTLNLADITSAGGAPLANPGLTGTPTAPTPVATDNSTAIATTQFVKNAIVAGTVASFNGRTGVVTLQANDISGAGGALLASPIFTGNPQAPTPAPGNNTTSVATTAFVTAAIAAAPATVSSFNGRTGAITLTTADVTGAGGAPIASPAFSGTPTAPTPAANDNSLKLATTAFVTAAIAAAGGVSSFNTRTGAVTLQTADITNAGGAPIANPSFTGTPAAPTAATATSTTQIATTAFVHAAITAGSVVTFNGRSGTVSLQSTDISGAGGALLASPAFTGTPTAPTPTAGTNNTTLATTQFVMSAVGVAGGVTSFNTRTGAVTLSSADITSAGGALLASPTFTGIPRAPTPAAADNSTTIATTAFVASTVGAYLPLAGGVMTGAMGIFPNSYINSGAGGYNTLYGQRSTVPRWALVLGDGATESGSNAGSNFDLYSYTDAGTTLGTPLSINRASGAATFSASPVAPTPAPGDNTTKVATTAFVANAAAPITAPSLAWLYNSVAQSIPATTWTVCNIDSAFFDLNSELSAASHGFVVKRTGYYRIDGNFNLSLGGPNTITCEIFKNGSVYLTGTSTYTGGSTNPDVLASGVGHFAAGDAITGAVYATSAATLPVQGCSLTVQLVLLG